MKLHLYKPSRDVRNCGECTACCTTCGSVELNKPLNVRCRHVTDHGCGIYENRPSGCRRYQCAWLMGLLPDKFRPDQSGVVWNFEEQRMPNGDVVVQAMLIHSDVTIERVEYQLAKLQQAVRDRLVCEIIPAGMQCQMYTPFHSKRVRPNIFLVDRPATEEDVKRLGIVGEQAPGT